MLSINPVPSVEYKPSDYYRSKNGTKRQKVKMHNFLLDCLRYWDNNQIMIYTDCNRIKGSFDIESLKNMFTGPLR